MRVYLDTSTIIDLIERPKVDGPDSDNLLKLLGDRHVLVYSFPLILELMSPIWNRKARTSVTNTMNRLEEFPHVWIDLVGLPNLEIRRAIECFSAKAEYVPPDPFVKTFVETVVGAPPEMRLFLNYSLAEAAFDLGTAWKFDPVRERSELLHQHRETIQRVRNLFKGQRTPDVALKEFFILRMVQRIQKDPAYQNVERHQGINLREIGLKIFEDPRWCPSSRLLFETYHSIARDHSDKLGAGDVWDVTQLQALPYVDLFSADRRIAAHITRVDRRLKTSYAQKTGTRLAELVSALK